MSNITRTIYGSKLQTSLTMGIPYQLDDNTTLNEKFEIGTSLQIPAGTYPSIKYVAIGRGGHYNTTGADGAALTGFHTHRARDAALFEHIPFVLRELADDLPPEIRALYALRREEVHNGTTYVAYYLKRLDTDGLDVDLKHTKIINGTPTSTEFIPSSADLAPEPVGLASTGVNSTSGDYVSAVTVLGVNLTAADIAEILNAAEIIYGSSDYAILSEIALCSGVDVVNSATTAGGTTFNYTEAVAVQLNVIQCTHHMLSLANNGLTVEYQVGASEPLALV